ncbi:diphthine synthase [Candidatus Pacearchaeota archaeon]|nr:diphthine synthase [Candidatus Pacearchaeota archaeon]
MTFYLIGLGLNKRSLTLEALGVLKMCKKIYIEEYTAEFPYLIDELQEIIGKRVIPLTRTMVEMENFVKEGKHDDIALLVYGSPLTATTHISLILKCRKEKIDYKIFENASIFDAISETGLQIYKFGKTASMPKWKDNYKPDSFLDIVRDNLKIKAHTLILIDIGLSYQEALRQFREACKNKIKLEKIVVCSRLGIEESKIFYDTLDELAGREVHVPFCFIIPSRLHFLEEEFLNNLQ